MLLYKESECRDGLCAIYDDEDNSLELLAPAYVAECVRAGIVIENLPRGGELYDLLNPKNKNLTRAKKEKNDEFYTQLTDIEKELSHYDPEIFRDKVIYCPTDVATDQGKILQSQFVHYFQLKKDDLKFKKLIATCLAEKGEEFNNKYILVRKLSPYADPSSPYYNPSLTEDDDRYWSWGESTSECKADSNYGSGDFRSEECLQFFDEADIVITNPPFSLFRDFMDVLMEHNVDFMVIGNKNAIITKSVFPLLKTNKVWLGFETQKEFVTSEGVTEKINGLTRWFTNIECKRRKEPLDLLPMSHWEREGVEYPFYDNYDAIDVGKVKQIPSDYKGIMGVPITFIDKYNPDQFEILALQAGNAKGVNTPDDLRLVGYEPMDGDKGGAGLVDGRIKYPRILIRHKAPSSCKYKVGDYLTFTYKGDRRGAEVSKVDGSEYFVILKTDGEEIEVSSSLLSAVRRI